MSFPDLLLHLDSYPEATPNAAIDEAIQFAAGMGCKLSALAVQVRFPVHSNRVADYLIDLSGLAQEAAAKSLAACRSSTDYFTSQAKAAGVFGEALIEPAEFYAAADHVAKRVRTRDLCLIPLAKPLYGQAEVVRRVVFGSGRPALAFRGEHSKPLASPLGSVVVAWDGSQRAACAMANALPFLVMAKDVHVFTAVGEKPSATTGLGRDVVRHLKTHGVAAVADEIDAQGATIGQVLDSYLEALAPDLLVMGAYGRSSGFRDFIWGGATEHALHDPKVPLFLAH